jgi:hypothetical protein
MLDTSRTYTTGEIVPRGRRLDTAKTNQILELRAKGYSFARIASTMGIGKQTAVDVCKENEEKVAALAALEFEELYETLKISAQERIRSHAAVLEKIRQEIDERDLSDVPTEKLIDLFMKESAALREEMIVPHFSSTDEQERDKEDRLLLDSIT